MKPPKTLALILAGGVGGRLEVLTEARAKPALPLGGMYHLIDVPLSNLAHSGLTEVWVLEQYRPHWLNEHLANGRPWDLDRTRGGLRVLPPYQGREREGFAEGNAASIHQHASFLREYGAELLLVLSADQLYRLDYREVIDRHVETEADLTLVTTEVALEEASRLSVVGLGDGGRVKNFAYKPEKPKSGVVAAEVFLYNTGVLLDTLDALADEGELGDYGERLLPHLVEEARVYAYPLEGYWRDLGTPKSYWGAHMDLLDGKVLLDDPAWPLLTRGFGGGPARLYREAVVDNGLVSPGCLVRGRVRRSVLGPGVVVEAGAEVEEAVVLEGVTIKAGSRVVNAVLDKGVVVGEKAQVGGEGELTLVGMNASIEEGAVVAAGERREAEVGDARR